MASFSFGMFMSDFSLSTGSSAKRGQVLLVAIIKIVHSNHSRCSSGVRLATSTDTYSTRKRYLSTTTFEIFLLLMGRIITCCVWGLLSIILYLFIVVTF